MMEKIKAKTNQVFYYGSNNRAIISINTRQVWTVIRQPSQGFPFYGITRQNVTLEITESDYNKYFKGVN